MSAAKEEEQVGIETVEEQDNFSLDHIDAEDEASLQKMYFQLRRSMRLMDAQLRRAKSEHNTTSLRDQKQIGSLLKDIEDIETGQMRKMGKAEIKKDKVNRMQLIEQRQTEMQLDKQKERLQKQVDKARKERRGLMDLEASHRERLGGRIDTTKRINQVQQRRVRMEKQIQGMNSKLGEVLAHNKKHRDHIESIKKNYNQFKELEEGFAEELLIIKDDISNEIVKAKINQKIQKATTLRLESLISRYEKDKQQYQSDVREMTVNLAHSGKMRNFTVTKLDARYGYQLRELVVNQKVDDEVFTSNEDKTLEQYNQALEKIKEITNENNINVICDRFINQEKDIVRMTTYINTLSDQLLEMDQQVNQYTESIQDLQDEREDLEWIKSENIKQVDEELGKVSVSVGEFNEQITLHKKRIGDVKANVDEIINLLHIEQAKFEKELIKPRFDFPGVLEYLSALSDSCTATVLEEEKANMLKQRNEEASQFGMIMQKTVKKRADEDFQVFIKTPHMHKNWSDEPHQDSQTGDIIGDEERVFTQEELYDRAEKKVAAREKITYQKEDSLVSSIYPTKKKTIFKKDRRPLTARY